MEKYTMFMDWKNQCSENEYTTQSNLQIQCNPYHATNGILHRAKTNNFTMEYYSAIKKNTFESVLMRWMKLEPIIQSEVSVQLLVTSWTAACQASLSIAKSRSLLKLMSIELVIFDK